MKSWISMVAILLCGTSAHAQAAYRAESVHSVDGETVVLVERVNPDDTSAGDTILLDGVGPVRIIGLTSLLPFRHLTRALQPATGPTPRPAPTSSVPSTPPRNSPAAVASEGNWQTQVYITRTGSKYHRAGCSALSRSHIPISLADAMARYGPCSLCNPPPSEGSGNRSPSSSPSASSSSPVLRYSAPSSPGGGQCRAITGRGTRCSRNARSGGYCWQHGG